MTVWGRAGLERVLALYLPVCAAIAGSLVTPRHRTRLAAVLLGLLWTAPALLLLQRANAAAGWWTFPGGTGFRLLQVPLELWIGWAVLWGVVPVFWLPRVPVGWMAAALVVLDLGSMPLCRATVALGPRWWMGELVAVPCILLPSLWLGKATLQRRHVRRRAAMQVLTAGLVFLYQPAEWVFAARGGGWAVLASWLPIQRQLLLQAGLVLALPGLAAVQEFAARGNGTPIPYDPPARLVATGVYRYLRNPMQTSCLLVMLVWALALRNPWLLAGPLLCVLYVFGLAAWDEDADLERRFGTEWYSYRRAVRPWWPRWRPHVAEDAAVYIAGGCAPCSEVRRWLERRKPVGLRILAAETLPPGSIRRMRYVCGDDVAEGVRAMARALEHLTFGWAMAGAAMRLPGIAPVLQAVADAVGFGPRELACGKRGASQEAA